MNMKRGNMAALDPRIEAVRVQYGLAASDFWELPQKKGTWVAKHAALEVAAAKAKIVFAPPLVLEADGTAKSAALCVTGTMGDRTEWSIGEASPANNKNAYPFAMAEKRGKDRVILKLIGIHGLAYSEDEADDFKQPPANGNGTTKPSALSNVPPQYEEDPDGQCKAWCDKEIGKFNAMTRLPDLLMWQDDREAELHRLLGKSPKLHRYLMDAFQAKQTQLSKKTEKA